MVQRCTSPNGKKASRCSVLSGVAFLPVRGKPDASCKNHPPPPPVAMSTSGRPACQQPDQRNYASVSQHTIKYQKSSSDLGVSRHSVSHIFQNPSPLAFKNERRSHSELLPYQREILIGYCLERRSSRDARDRAFFAATATASSSSVRSLACFAALRISFLARLLSSSFSFLFLICA